MHYRVYQKAHNDRKGLGGGENRDGVNDGVQTLSQGAYN